MISPLPGMKWCARLVPRNLKYTHEGQGFKTAIELVSSGLFMKLILPGYAMGLTKRGTRISLGFAELKVRLFVAR
jgi:hypothetical protein